MPGRDRICTNAIILALVAREGVSGMNRRYSVVSTCSEEGWHEYGTQFVDSFLWHFPEDVSLIFYVDFEAPIKSPRIIYRHLNECYGLDDFQRSISALPFAKGHAVVHDLHRQAHNPHIIWNARKFSFKIFSVEHAVLNAADDVVMWVDADTVAFRDLDRKFLSSLAPSACMLSYIGREGKYSECGFVAYNVRHWACAKFVRNFADLYRSGTIFGFKEWHDSYVFDLIRSAYEQEYGVRNYNISFDEMLNDHAFVNCQLGKYLDHLKGPRKGEGRSRASDLTVKHDDVDYWRP